jgi:DeoR family transcriptional regulator, fructose operon transcriptional repressor
VVLADHTKFGNDCFARFADLKEVDTVVTDDGLEPALANKFEAAGVRLVLA